MALPLFETPAPPPPARPRPLLVKGTTQAARQASADGALLNAPKREYQCAELLRYIEAQGYRGVTDAEIARDLKWPVNVVTARRNDLVRDGLVVVRWPNARRRSCTTRVRVVVWVATSVVRQMPPRKSYVGGAPCASGPHGNDAEPARMEDAREVATAGETASEAASAGTVTRIGEPVRNTATPGISWEQARDESSVGSSRAESVEAPEPVQFRHAATSSPVRLTRETAKTVGWGTPVRLLSGRFAKVCAVSRDGDIGVRLPNNLTDTLKAESLLDCRETDGELVEAG